MTIQIAITPCHDPAAGGAPALSVRTAVAVSKIIRAASERRTVSRIDGSVRTFATATAVEACEGGLPDDDDDIRDCRLAVVTGSGRRIYWPVGALIDGYGTTFVVV